MTSLAILEPTIASRDREFFELAVTLIPIFFLAGTIATIARAPERDAEAKPRHLAAVFLLALFVLIEINAELVGIESLVSSSVTSLDRYLVLTGLILAILGASVSIVAPWVRHFYASGGDFRGGAVMLTVLGLFVIGSVMYGSYRVYDAVFELADTEILAKELEHTSDIGLGRDKKTLGMLRANGKLARLHIRFARLCRVQRTRPLHVDERLAQMLVYNEINTLLIQGRLTDVVKPSEIRHQPWLHGECA